MLVGQFRAIIELSSDPVVRGQVRGTGCDRDMCAGHILHTSSGLYGGAECLDMGL